MVLHGATEERGEGWGVPHQTSGGHLLARCGAQDEGNGGGCLCSVRDEGVGFRWHTVGVVLGCSESLGRVWSVTIILVVGVVLSSVGVVLDFGASMVFDFGAFTVGAGLALSTLCGYKGHSEQCMPLSLWDTG